MFNWKELITLHKNRFLRSALVLILAMALAVVFLASCDGSADPAGTDTGSPTSSDTSSPTETGGTPTPTPPSPGDYLGGNTFDPAFNPTDPDCPAYVVETPATPAASINVTLVIEAGDYIDEDYDIHGGSAFRKEMPITLGDGVTSKNYTVTDLLEATDGQNGFTFYGIEGTNLVEFTDTTSYLAAVYYNEGQIDGLWQSGSFAYDGWVFRINDKLPVQVQSVVNNITYYEGASILQTPVNDGDIVHFFYDFPAKYSPSGSNLAANYVRAEYQSKNGNQLTISLKSHNTYIDEANDLQFQVNNYDIDKLQPEATTTAYLYEVDGIYVTEAQFSPNGVVTFILEEPVVSGTSYIVKTDSVLYSGDNDFDYANVLFTLTGAYSKITEE
jgi:hypothetical protein